MVAFICLFFPAVISVWVFDCLTRRDLSMKQFIYHFCLNTVLINLAYFFVKLLFMRNADLPLYDPATDMLPIGAIKYLLAAVPIGVAIVLIEVLLFRNVKISVEEDRNGKEKE